MRYIYLTFVVLIASGCDTLEPSSETQNVEGVLPRPEGCQFDDVANCYLSPPQDDPAPTVEPDWLRGTHWLACYTTHDVFTSGSQVWFTDDTFTVSTGSGSFGAFEWTRTRTYRVTSAHRPTWDRPNYTSAYRATDGGSDQLRVRFVDASGQPLRRADSAITDTLISFKELAPMWHAPFRGDSADGASALATCGSAEARR